MRIVKKTNAIIKDIGGKRCARWVENAEGGTWIMDAEAGSEWEFLRGAVVIALPPKNKKGKGAKI